MAEIVENPMKSEEEEHGEAAAPVGVPTVDLVKPADALREPLLFQRFVRQESETVSTEVCARFEKTPTNFHQATYYYVCDPDSAQLTKLKFLAMSFGIVLLQTLAAGSLIVAIAKTNCGSKLNAHSTTQCPTASWCPARVGEIRQCAECGAMCGEFDAEREKCGGPECLAGERSHKCLEGGIAPCNEQIDMNYNITHNYCPTNVTITVAGRLACDYSRTPEGPLRECVWGDIPEWTGENPGGAEYSREQDVLIAAWKDSRDPARREYAGIYEKRRTDYMAPRNMVIFNSGQGSSKGMHFAPVDDPCWQRHLWVQNGMFGCSNQEWMRWQCQQYYLDPTYRDKMFVIGQNLVNAHTIASMCDDCRGKVGREPVMLSTDAHSEGIIDRMTDWEWYMLWLCLSVISLSYAAEVRDVKFTEFSQENALGKLESKNCCGGQSDYAGFLPADGWHAALYFLAYLRQFVFLSVLITAVPMMIARNGGDAQTIALSGVSILFFLEFDNQVYHYGLDEDVREFLDQHGRVQMTAEKVTMLARIKMAHIVLLPLMGVLTLRRSIDQEAGLASGSALLMPPLFMSIIAGIETFLKLLEPSADMPHRIGSVVRYVVLKVFGSYIFYFVVIVNAGYFNESN